MSYQGTSFFTCINVAVNKGVHMSVLNGHLSAFFNLRHKAHGGVIGRIP
jgi:hypothetical protein